ncbi:MAG: winged helix DNA-binding domain-containing protein [Anaerolineae bacterium]
MTASLRASGEQVLAFRLAAHNLTRRLPPGSLPEAAAACGIQDSPPGAAAVALSARVQGLTVGEVDRALATAKTLLRLRSLRTAPHIVPTADAATFTIGLLPEDEESLRFFILGAGPALDKVGISGTDLAAATAAAVADALDGRVLPFRQLSSELTERLARHLPPEQLEAWRSPSWYGPNQSLGEALVHFALYVVSLQGTLCFAPRHGNEAAFARTDKWLGRPVREVDPDRARADLVRRYLRCYGPSTAERFAEWAGISPAAAGRRWDLLAADLVPVGVAGSAAWLHRDDVAAFAAAPEAEGIRLLPPHDPYLGQRDREMLLSEARLRRQVWRSSGNPGVVLVDGRVAAMWRSRKVGKRLAVTVEPFIPLSAQARAAIDAEAELVARMRDAADIALTFVDL